MGSTHDLAAFIVGSSAATIGDDVRRLAHPPIVDTIGVMLAGLASPIGPTMTRYLGRPETSTLGDIFDGRGHGVDAEARALVGGTVGHALDFDDVSDPGHPSSIVLSTILGASTATGPLTGERLMEAYAVGYEVSVKVSRALGPAHYRAGWHTTCTGGSFGATAAAAKLLGLDLDQTTVALGITGSLVGGLQRNFGTMTKPLHSGLAARNGLMAAHLASNGLSAALDILDGPRGFFDIFGAGESDAAIIITLGQPWAMGQRTPALKKYASCYSTHRPIEATLAIQREHRLDASEIETVVVSAPTLALLPLLYSDPETGLEAKFSAEYCLAAALVDHDVTIDSFSDESVQRESVRAVMNRMTIREDPRCRPDDPTGAHSRPGSGGFWEVVVHTRDGRELAATAAFAPGSPQAPLTWDEIGTKFRDCLRVADCDVVRGGQVFDALRSVEQVADVHALLRDLRP